MSSDTAKTKESKRKQVRYNVSDDCRVKAAIKLRSADKATAAKDWSGTLVDVSAEGAHIQISMGAVAYVGDACVLTLAHGGVKTDIRGILAHYVTAARYSVCGVKFDFTFSGADKGYQPFFKALLASSTLKGGPVDGDVAKQYKEEFRGPGYSKLVVQRDNKPERSVVAFDYVMGRYAAALTNAGPDMFKNKENVGFRAAPVESGGTGGAALTSEQEKEARWEFSIAASNLPKVVGPELRKFFRLVS